MTHAIRTRLLTLCLAILLAGIVFSSPLISPLVAQSRTPSFSTHSVTTAFDNWVALHGDLNNDGYEDLITSPNTFSFRVYISKGNGAYQAPITYFINTTGVFYYPSNPVALADFNSDGKLDFVYQNASSFQLWLGNGDGTFRSPINIVMSQNIVAMAVADINHDGKADILLSTISGLQVLFGNGDGTFHSGPAKNNFPQAAILTGDFDGDGNVDLAVAPSTELGTQVEVFRGDGAGDFTESYSSASGYQLTLTAADVNADGISDLVGTGVTYDQNHVSHTSLLLFVYYGQTTGSMTSSQIPLENYGVGKVAVADFNGDQIPDIALFETNCNDSSECTVSSAAALNVLSGIGNGGFAPETSVSTVKLNPGTPFALRGNRDSKADLVFSNNPFVHTNTLLITLLNTTAGNFPTCAPPNATIGIAQCSPTAGSTVSSPVSFAIGAAATEPIRKIELWADGKKQLEQFAGAFSNYGFLNASVPLTAGSHMINIIASGFDNSQQSKMSTLTVGASSSCSAPSSAGVHICSPVSGASVSSPVLVTATSKVTGTIVSTQLWVDGVKNFNAPGSTTLTTSVTLAAGSHRFAVIATNTAGTKWESTVNATVK